MMVLARALTAEEQEEFNRDGVVCLRSVVSDELVDMLRDAIDEAVRTYGTSPAGYDLTRICDAIHACDLETLAKDSSGQYNVLGLAAAILQSKSRLLVDENIGTSAERGRFVLDTGIADRIAGFRNFSLHGPGPEIAARLMKSSQVRFYDDQIFVKEPGTRERTAYHQDGPYFHLDGDQICTQWIPVDVVSKDISLRYVRGSHRWGKKYRPNVFIAQMEFPGSVGETLPDIESNEANYDLISFDVRPGDMVVHHHLTIHGAPGNSHNSMRRAAGVRYCGDDVRFRHQPAAPVLAHHRHSLKDGDPLDCAQFPIVWPLARNSSQAA
jgi:ectoine hydroxylase-related dioxygenase (phytanoyl-CoA dioxygenase family)